MSMNPPPLACFALGICWLLVWLALDGWLLPVLLGMGLSVFLPGFVLMFAVTIVPAILLCGQGVYSL